MASKYAGVIIAFDLAGNTGVAQGEPGNIPTFDTPKLRKDEDDPLDSFGRGVGYVADALNAPRAIAGRMYGPGEALEAGLIRVAIEAPIMNPMIGNTNAQSQLITKGLWASVGGFAKRRGVPVRCVSPGQCRKHFIGVGNLPSEEAKRTVKRMCEALGWTPPTFDCADAGAVWHWASFLWHPDATPVVAGLFSRIRSAA